MKFRKAFAGVVVALSLVAGTAACTHGVFSNGNTAESKQQQQDTTNLETSQPLPAVFFSQERQNLIDIELAEVNDVRTTSFVVTAMGALLYSCPSIGFGIPDSASLSNPQQISWGYNSWGNGEMDSGVTSQMDPNGIYAPTSSAGTWIICLTKLGIPYINRFEDTADTIGGPAEWVQNPANGQHIVQTGSPTALASTVDGKKAAVDKRK
jgi:hypothetical protein